MANITVTRYHDFSYGHRVVGHESCCKHLHGHNGRVHFTCEAEKLDEVGRVIDFAVIKEKLCMWLENNWDHKFLAWEKDKLCKELVEVQRINECGLKDSDFETLEQSIIFVPFNPTAENMALHLLNEVGPAQLKDTNVRLVCVSVEETSKCSATVTI
jgi:6-pyruvoyltetrahydropterin/6-carboxytetrahydropterin synthase